MMEMMITTMTMMMSKVRHSRSKTPSPIMRSKAGHFRADSQPPARWHCYHYDDEDDDYHDHLPYDHIAIDRYSSKASLRKSTENMAGGKELITARESTYPVF